MEYLWWQFSFCNKYAALLYQLWRQVWKQRVRLRYLWGLNGFQWPMGLTTLWSWMCTQSWRPFFIDRRRPFRNLWRWSILLDRIGTRLRWFFIVCSFQPIDTNRTWPWQGCVQGVFFKFSFRYRCAFIGRCLRFNNGIFCRRDQAWLRFRSWDLWACTSLGWLFGIVDQDYDDAWQFYRWPNRT